MGSRSEHSRFKRSPSPDFSGNFLGDPMPRRSFLIKAAKVATGTGLVATGIVSADTAVGNFIWGGTNPEIGKTENSEAAKKFPHTWTLAIGGYNVDDTDRLATSISPAMTRYSQVGYLRQPNNGLQIEDIKRAADRFVDENKVQDMYLYGHSMGGMLAVELGAHLVERGVKLNGIILDCSPLNFMDLRDSKKKQADILVFSDKIAVHGGPLMRFIIEMGARWGDGRRDILKMCEDAIREINPKGCSNRLVQSQARYMTQFSLDMFANAFDPSMPFIHLRPDNFDDDPTINNLSSQLRLRRMFMQNPVMDAPVTGGRHANPSDCQQGYTDAMIKAATDCQFYDGSSGRSYTLFQ